MLFFIYICEKEQDCTVYKIQGLQPKRKKRTKTLGKAISLLGLGAYQPKFLLEGYLPASEIATFIVKDDPVPGCPYDPAGCYDNFPETVATKSCSCFNNHI